MIVLNNNLVTLGLYVMYTQGFHMEQRGVDTLRLRLRVRISQCDQLACRWEDSRSEGDFILSDTTSGGRVILDRLIQRILEEWPERAELKMATVPVLNSCPRALQDYVRAARGFHLTTAMCPVLAWMISRELGSRVTWAHNSWSASVVLRGGDTVRPAVLQAIDKHIELYM